MSYTSIYFDKDNTEHEYKRDISNQELKSISDSIEFITNYMNEIDYCLMIRYNYMDFVKYAGNVKLGEKYNFINLNRLLNNLLNSFYVWIEYHEKSYRTLFSKLKRKYYDNYFEYRLGYNLRKYTTHIDLGITSLSFDILTEKKTIQIDLDRIIKNGKDLNATFLKELGELRKQTQYIDTAKFIKGLFYCIEAFQGEIWNDTVPEANKNADNILFYLKHEGLKIFESYIVDSDTHNHVMSLSNPVSKFINKISEIPLSKEIQNL